MVAMCNILNMFLCLRLENFNLGFLFFRITSFSFRSQVSVSRRLRINNVLADIESIGNRSPDPDSSTSSELTQSSSHQLSKGT